MATKASRIALAGSNISSTGEVDADLLDNIDSAAFLSLDSNGRLGIGIPSPMSQLHVNKDVAGHNTNGITIGKVEANGWIDINEEMGRLSWSASYGSSYTPGIGAYISAKADANWDGNETPTRLGFFTAPESSTTPVERMRIDSSGRLTVGSIGTDTTLSGGQPGLQVTGSGFNGYMAAVRRDSSVYSSGLLLAKSRNSSADSFTALQDNDKIGSIIFIGDDGTDLDTYGAMIQAEVNGTPSQNNMPADLILSTNSGTSAVTERMRIRKDGNVGIGTNNPGYKLQVDHGTAAQYASSIRNTADNLQLLLGTTTGGLLNIQGKTISSNAAYQIALNAEGGKVGVGTASPDYPLQISGSNVLSGGGLATLGIYDTGTAYNGTNPGGGITFRGKYNSTGSLTNFATVQGIKENATDGNYDTALRFTTRANGGNLTEKMRIDHDGNVGIGTTSMPYGRFQVNQINNNDESGIGILDSTAGRSMRLWCNNTTSFINSGNGGGGILVLNEGSGNVGIGTSDPNFRLHVNKGANTYNPTTGISENVVGFQTDYDGAGSQLLTFSRLDGNWLDGTTGADSAFGWLWNYQTSTRAGIVYDHRSTEKFQIFSSYGAISFLTPDAIDGNATPNDSNMNERLQIHPGGAIGMGVIPYTNTKLTIGGTTASYNATLMFDNNTAGGAEFFMLATDNTWSVGADKFIMGHGAPSSNNVDLEIDGDGYVHTTRERLSVGANLNATTGKRGLRVGRTVINWFNYGSQSSARYLHIKTNLVNQTGSNPEATMSMFHIRGYTYGAENIDSMLGFHNWSGTYYNTAYTNNGHRTVVSASFAPYRSTDNKVVIVLDLGVNTYAGVSIDYMQNYEYTWRDVEVSAYSRSTNTSGVY